MPKRDPYELSARMQRLEEAHPSPSPEQAAQNAERCLLLLTNHHALDVAPLLGLGS